MRKQTIGKIAALCATVALASGCTSDKEAAPTKRTPTATIQSPSFTTESTPSTDASSSGPMTPAEAVAASKASTTRPKNVNLPVLTTSDRRIWAMSHEGLMGKDTGDLTAAEKTTRGQCQMSDAQLVEMMYTAYLDDVNTAKRDQLGRSLAFGFVCPQEKQRLLEAESLAIDLADVSIF